jgi:hypothetical protein
MDSINEHDVTPEILGRHTNNECKQVGEVIILETYATFANVMQNEK